jgi:NAD-dependent deacetylase
MPGEASIDRVARWLAEARSVVVLTGAGVSAESGLTTFRDPEEGLWSKYDPMDLATIEAFERDPELVTRWYHWRFTKARDVRPNPGHDALALLERKLAARMPDGPPPFTLITQNIDGLHQQAGSRRVVEIHGSIHRWRCTCTGHEKPLAEIRFDRFPVPSEHGGFMRPCVVWFGEMLPQEALEASFEALARCDLFFSIGTSATVYPAAGFIEVARAAGARTVEINKDPTANSPSVDVALKGRSGAILPDLLRRMDQLARGGDARDT